MSFSDRLKEARKKSGFTQKQLADELGVTPAMIAQYETGKRQPKSETLTKIAEALKVGYSYAQNGEPYFYCFVDTVRHGNENEKFNEYQYEDAMTSVSDGKIPIPIRKQIPETVPDLEKDTKNMDFLNKMDELGQKLNDKGKDKALEQVELLTKIPEYRSTRAEDHD